MISYLQPDMFGHRTVDNWPFGGLQPQAFALIVADPPWFFQLHNIETGSEKSPHAHYECMQTADIAALPVGDLARTDAVLWLWATWPMLPDAMTVLNAWGFTYATGGAWDKERWGGGYILRSVCEPFLIATKGAPKINGYPDMNR